MHQVLGINRESTLHNAPHFPLASLDLVGQSTRRTKQGEGEEEKKLEGEGKGKERKRKGLNMILFVRERERESELGTARKAQCGSISCCS